MSKLGCVGLFLVVGLTGCASTGVIDAESAPTETFSVATDSASAYRRAAEYMRTCHVRVQHPYGVAYAFQQRPGTKGTPDEVFLYKTTEPATILERIGAQSDGPTNAKVTVTVLGEGRWDAAELAAAKASIQSATPICRQDTGK